jgi:uncharacterized phage-like protein YoqJ
MIRIGVTGHRILANQEKVRSGIRDVIHRLIISFHENEWEIISALAEGADCLFVEEVMNQLHAKLSAVLPLLVSEYLQEFHEPSRKSTFEDLLNKAKKIVRIEQKPSREEAYLEAGRYIVDHCDILVAIWDGQKAQGIGGTGDIVKLARQRFLPLAWIRAGNRRHGTKEPIDLGSMQGNVSYERFPNS